MQIRTSHSVFPTRIILLFACLISGATLAQSKEDLENAQALISDSLFEASQKACMNPAENRKPETWLNRARVLSAILDDPNLVARHFQTDIPVETANALLMLKVLDGEQKYRHFTEPGLAGICIDLGNSGIHALENARLYDSEEDAKKAAGLLEKTMECYRLTGESRPVVDNEWAKNGLDLDWFQFFTGVAMRKAGDKTRSSQLFTPLLEKEWPRKNLYLEAANLSDSLGLIAESVEILKKGLKKLPGDIELYCALVQQHLRAGESKEAASWLKKAGLNRQSQFHPEYAYAQGSFYENQGNLSKAMQFYEIPYRADSNEVSAIRRYAAFLLRNAGRFEGSSADQQAALSYRLLRRAQDLSPENRTIRREMEAILIKYPEADKS